MTDNLFNKVTIDFITHTPNKEEFALYLVENSPWGDVESRIKQMQARVYTALDAVLDGIISSDYPESKGKRIRIEVVCRGASPPKRFREVVDRINEIAHSVGDYARDLKNTEFVASLLITYSEETSSPGKEL